MHAFIASRLDYCNVAEGHLSRVQSVQNTTARLVSGLGRREHVIPSTCTVPLDNLGLPLLVRRTLHRRTCPTTSLQPLECALCAQLTPGHVYLVAHTTDSDRCYATTGPGVWNSLQQQLRQPNFIEYFFVFR